MNVLDRLVQRLRGEGKVPESREAAKRSDQIAAHVEQQELEVLRHSIFARHVIAENHLAPKIRHAMRESK